MSELRIKNRSEKDLIIFFLGFIGTKRVGINVACCFLRVACSGMWMHIVCCLVHVACCELCTAYCFLRLSFGLLRHVACCALHDIHDVYLFVSKTA